MKQQSELYRDVTDPGWRERESEREAKFLVAVPVKDDDQVHQSGITHFADDATLARIAELEVIDAARSNAVQEAIDNAEVFQARIAELEAALAKSASREAALVEKLKVAEEALAGIVGVGRHYGSRVEKQCEAALAKIKEAS